MTDIKGLNAAFKTFAQEDPFLSDPDVNTFKPESKPTPAKETASESESDSETLQESQDSAYDKLMAEKYQFKDEDLNDVMDGLILAGSYEEEFSVRGKFNFKLRTRSVKAMREITMYMDAQSVNTFEAYNQVRSLVTLAHTLVEIKGRDLSLLPVTSEEGTSRMQYLENLPGPMLGFIMEKLEYFDYKVVQATRKVDDVF